MKISLEKLEAQKEIVQIPQERGSLEAQAQSREQADEKENRRKDDLRSNYIEKIKGLIKLTEREEG